ncbi:MAG TPA: Ig-like domain-containing protein [Longimicrobiaceae bacterium]|nr:Ig-like domain-containing protein [Longimicrobiaceae bacterium]
MSLAKKLVLSALALSLSAVLPSCDSGVTAPNLDASAEFRRLRVVLDRSDLELLAGEAVQIDAQVVDESGRVVSKQRISWSSSSPEVAHVGPDGAVSALRTGEALIGASVGGQTTTLRLAVKGNSSSVQLRPEAVTLNALRDTVRLLADARDNKGNPVAPSSLKWTSLNPAVATVSDVGLVTGTATGTALVTARYAGKEDTTTVEVRQVVASVAVTPTALTLDPGQTQPLSGLAKDANGNEIPGVAFEWMSSNTAVATVSASGQATAVAAGTSYVTARAGGKSATATLTVAAPVKVQAQVASVSVSPASASIVVGGSVVPVATARDASGNVLTGRLVEWSTSNPAVAGVSASGLVTGVAVGSATIIATVEGKTGAAAVSVTTDPATVPSRVMVSPRADTLSAIGAATQLGATVYSQAGSPMSGAVVSWTSLNSGVATVDGSGRVVAKAPGTARVVAASGALADTATVVVRQVIASVVVSPSAPTVQVGQTQQVSASARDANGHEVPGVTFGWTSSNTAAATVNGSGLVSGVAAGTSYVTASAGGKSAVSTVTVAAVPVATVTVSPGTASIAVGGSVDLAAVARDGSGQVLTGRPVTWATSNAGVATVSSTGVVTGVAGGTVTVTATSEGKSGTAQVTVSAPTVTTSTLVYGHDFNDGTIGAFGQWGSHITKPVSVIADPTGSGRGSVARVDYVYDPASGGAHDSNGGLYYRANPAGGHPSGVGFGERIYLAGDFYLPRYPYTAPAQAQNDQRKLIYLKFGDPNARTGDVVVNLWGRADKSGMDLQLVSGWSGSSTREFAYGIAPVAFDRWHRVEVELTANTRGMANGSIRVWFNGQLVKERTNVMLFGASPSEATDFIYEYGIGNQEQWAPTDLMKDYRLWDNIHFRTARP